MSRIIPVIIVIGISIGHTIYRINHSSDSPFSKSYKENYNVICNYSPGYINSYSDSKDFGNYITLREALKENTPRYSKEPSLYEIYFYNDSEEKYDIINMMDRALGALPRTRQSKNAYTAASVLRLVATARSEKSYELARDEMLGLASQITDISSANKYKRMVNDYFADPKALLQKKQQKERELEAEYEKSGLADN
jgi:hypothetical protein